MPGSSDDITPDLASWSLGRTDAEYIALKLAADKVWWDDTASARTAYLAAWSSDHPGGPEAVTEAAGRFMAATASARDRYARMLAAARALYAPGLGGPGVELAPEVRDLPFRGTL